MNLRTFEELHTSIKMQLCDLYHIEQNIVIVDLEEMRTVGSLVPGYLLKSFMRAPLPFWPHRSTSLAVSYLENKEPITSKLKSSENPQRIIYGIYMMDPLLRAPRGSSTPWWWWKESQAKKKVLQASTFHFPGSSSAPLKKKTRVLWTRPFEVSIPSCWILSTDLFILSLIFLWCRWRPSRLLSREDLPFT